MPAWLLSLFANPWMLLWLPAAATPLLIHLWNRRKYREVPWAAMEYLLAAIVKSSRRMRIEQLLLLLVRTALVLLIVIALAEPFLSAVASPFVTGARIHRVLVIDGSYSMAYQPSDKTAFDVAKERAVEIVKQGNEGDGYSLVLMADPTQVIVGTASYNQDEVIREIDALDLPHAGADLDGALKAVEEVIQEVARDQRQLTRHHVYFLSDLGQNTWSTEGGEEGRTDQRSQRLARLNEKGLVEVVAIGSRRGDNLAVTRIGTTASYATITQPSRVHAAIKNFSNQGRQQRVELWVDGRRADQQTVEVPAGAETNVVFQHRFHTPGDHAVEVRISGDPLEIDNRRYLVLPVKQHLDALLVSGKRGATLTVEAALDGGDFQRGLGGTIRPEVVSESQLLELDLDRYDCIFLCNIGQLTPAEAKAIGDYVHRGGGLITFLGDQVIPDRYNRALFETEQGGRRILPARLVEPVYDGEYQFIDPLKYRHPMLAKWKGSPKSGLATVGIVKYVRLEVPEESQASIVMALGTGDPLVVEEQIGDGRSVVVATDLSMTSIVDADTRRPWSFLGSWLNCQVFVDGLWKLAVGGRAGQRNVLVGDVIGARVERATGQASLFVTTPRDPQQPVPVAMAPDASFWSFAGTLHSGFYRVTEPDARATDNEDAGAATATDESMFAVNVDIRESDLTKRHPEDLPTGFHVHRQWQDIEQPAEATLEPPKVALHQLLLCTVLGLLFTETFLAWWIGHRSA